MLGLRYTMVVIGNGSWPIVFIRAHSHVMQGNEVTMEIVDVTLLEAWITLDQWFSTRGDFASQNIWHV